MVFAEYLQIPFWLKIYILNEVKPKFFLMRILLLGKSFGWAMLDPMVGIIGGIVIAKWAIGLIRDSSKVLLEIE